MVATLLSACGSSNMFGDDYGYLHKDDKHLTLLTIDSDKAQVNGAYHSYDLVEEGIVETDQIFQGKIHNGKLLDINVGLATNGIVNGDKIELTMPEGEIRTFQRVTKEEFQDALNSLKVAAATTVTTTEESVADVKDDAEPVSIEKKEDKEVPVQEIVDLTAGIDAVHNEIVSTIEEKGWYDSMDEMPSDQQFEKAVRPIVTPYFSEAFVSNTILANKDAFFCYCDAPGPLQGSMNPDVLAGMEQSNDGSTVTFTAFRPANEINSGVKLRVEVVKEEDTWKIDSMEPQFSTHDQSFELTVDQVQAYYESKGTEITHVDTIVSSSHKENVYIFEDNEGNKIGVDSRNWYTAEGEEWINQVF